MSNVPPVIGQDPWGQTMNDYLGVEHNHLAGVETALTGIDVRLETAEASVADHETRIAALEAAVALMQTQIAGLSPP